MAIKSYRRLGDATLARYEEAERVGTLTNRQKSALESHRGLSGAVSRMREEHAARKQLEKEEATK